MDLFHVFLYHIIDKAIGEPEVTVADNVSGNDEEEESQTPQPLTLDEFLAQRKLSVDGKNINR